MTAGRYAPAVERLLLGSEGADGAATRTAHKRPPDAIEANALRRALGLGPWGWPAARGDAEAFFGGPPPAARVGDVLAVTVSETRASVWALGDAGRHGLRATPFDGSTDAVWRTASAALGRSLPLLWRPLQDEAERLPCAWRLGSVRLDETCDETPEDRLCGPSFGLAFAFALASRLLGVVLPTTFAATGAVDAEGRVLPVEGLRHKLRALAHWAPGVRTVLVPQANARDARRAARALRLELAVVPVSTVGAALRKALRGRLAEELAAAGDSPAKRSELVATMFRMTMGSHALAPDWRPVAEAARQAERDWSRLLDDDERRRLRIARAVAARHAYKRSKFPALPDAWLAARPLSLRLRIVAHAVQECADNANAPEARVRALGERHLAPLTEAATEHLHVLGALARLDAVTGAPDQALERQRQIAHAFVEACLPQETSFSLCEWYRLAGALGRELDEADDFRRRVESLGGFDDFGGRFVAVKRALALALRGAPEAAQAIDALLARPERVPKAMLIDTLRRHRARVALAAGDEAAWVRQVAAIRAPLQRRLAALDRAVHEGDGADALNALVRTRPTPQGAAHLARAARQRPDGPAWFARLYPY